METDRVVIPGIIKNGLVVPQSHTPLPEGTRVEIVIPAADPEPGWRAEFNAWDRAGDEARAQIDQWEQEEPSSGQGIAGPARVRRAPGSARRSRAGSGRADRPCRG